MAIQDKPLQRRNLKNPQILSYTDAIREGQKSYHVFPREGAWVIKRIGQDPVQTCATKEEAIEKAKIMTFPEKLDIFVHNFNGLIEKRISLG